jgi:hypothetical protein
MDKRVVISAVAVAAVIALVVVSGCTSPQNVSPTPVPTDKNSTTPSPKAASSSGPTPVASPKTNESAIITFEVPIQIFEDEYRVFSGYYAGVKKDSPNAEEYYDYFFTCAGYIAWAPMPYVRYYEVNPHYNGNTKQSEPLFNNGDYRTWGDPKVTGSALHEFKWPETSTVYIGPESISHMFGGAYKGLYTALPTYAFFEGGVTKEGPTMWSPALHGTPIIYVTTRFDHSEKLTREQMNAVEIERRNFLKSYVQGWTFTIKNVS